MSIGSNIIYREKLSSTNDLASEMAVDNKAPEGTVIYAGEQTKGRGQRGNIWVSEPGNNLTFSIILYPEFLKADKQFMISKIISLSAARLLGLYTGSITIKWPNDIYYKNDKIAGILIENSLEGDTIQCSVAGVGININQSGFPSGLPNPISLRQITGNNYDPESILSQFCNICDDLYSKLKTGLHEEINVLYHNNIYMLNRHTGFEGPQGRFRGTIRGVDEFGRLNIEMENLEIKSFGFKEIEFIDKRLTANGKPKD